MVQESSYLVCLDDGKSFIHQQYFGWLAVLRKMSSDRDRAMSAEAMHAQVVATNHFALMVLLVIIR